MGGFYRYDHGVRDPGYPRHPRAASSRPTSPACSTTGTSALSVKYIDDRNQFILPLPFTNPSDPQYVPGFGNYGVDEHQRGPGPPGAHPDGRSDAAAGQRTQDQGDLVHRGRGVRPVARTGTCRTPPRSCRTTRSGTRSCPCNVFTGADYITGSRVSSGLGFPPAARFQYFFTNHFDATGSQLPFDTPNGLVAPSGEWHVDKPISAVQDQLQLRRRFGKHSLDAGRVLRQLHPGQPLVLHRHPDGRAGQPALPRPGGHTAGRHCGFGHQERVPALPLHLRQRNGTDVDRVSGVLGGEIQLTDRLRADRGRAGANTTTYVQSSENTPRVRPGRRSTTTSTTTRLFGNGSFRHFTRNITDWSASVGLNYRLNDNSSRSTPPATAGYKMPALDEFLNAAAQEQVDLFDSREVQSVEGGVKDARPRTWASR